jgi:hypothetical protein
MVSSSPIDAHLTRALQQQTREILSELDKRFATIDSKWARRVGAPESQAVESAQHCDEFSSALYAGVEAHLSAATLQSTGTRVAALQSALHVFDARRPRAQWRSSVEVRHVFADRDISEQPAGVHGRLDNSTTITMGSNINPDGVAAGGAADRPVRAAAAGWSCVPNAGPVPHKTDDAAPARGYTGVATPAPGRHGRCLPQQAARHDQEGKYCSGNPYFWQRASTDPLVSKTGARKLFDEMPTSDRRSPDRVLDVTIRQVCYPMSESVLHAVFAPYGRIERIHVIGGLDPVLAKVVFQLKHEAAEAYGDLHGRNIYDGCCQMEINWGFSQEQDVSRSSVESNLRSSNASHARRSIAGVTNNGVHKVLFPVGQQSDNEPPSAGLRYATGGVYNENGSVVGRLGNDDFGSNNHTFDEGSVGKFENGETHSHLDPYVESMALLQPAQEAFENEIQKFVEIRKDTDEDSTSSQSEIEWNSSPVEELNDKIKMLESKPEEATMLIKERDSQILELDALNHVQPQNTIACNDDLLALQSDVDPLLLEKMEAKIQCFILTRASRDWTLLAKDQFARSEALKSLLTDHKSLKTKLQHAENRVMLLEDWTFRPTATQVQSACYFTYRASHQHKWGGDFTDQISVSMWLYSSGQSNSFQVLLTWCFAYCSAYNLLDGFLSKDNTKKLQMPWDPGLQNLHRLEGESIFLRRGEC